MVGQVAVITIEWCFLGAAYFFFILRLYVRLRLKRERLILADGFLLVALASAQGLLICDTLTFTWGMLNDWENPSTEVLKVRFATNYFFDVGIYWPKFSILAFFNGIIPITKPQMRITLAVLAGFTFVAFLFTLFADTFWCGSDPSINWQQSSSCTTFEAMDLMRANWSLNITAEVLLLLYPFPLLADLKLSSTREKTGVGIIFGLGIVTVSVSVGRFATMSLEGNALIIYIWATAELCISITIVTFTALRPLLRQLAKTRFRGNGFSLKNWIRGPPNVLGAQQITLSSSTGGGGWPPQITPQPMTEEMPP